MEKGISRRTFIAGSAMAGMAASTAASLHGEDAFANETAASESVSCDIVIVGAGNSGLAACVQAAELGAKVVCVERQGSVGGNGQFTRGIFGLGSRLMTEQGTTADGGAMIRDELRASQYRGSGIHLSSMVKAAAGNIDWLLDQGVTFTAVEHETFHDFAGHYAGASEHYTAPMEARARALGVDFLLDTLATDVVMGEDGSACGVMAEGPQGTVRIDAKAVILGGGGFVQNKELMQEYIGVDIDRNVQLMGNPGIDGSTIQMAIAAGAKSNMGHAGVQGTLQVIGLPDYIADGAYFSGTLENEPFPGIWVNQDAVRYVNEDCGKESWPLSDMATMAAEDNYVLLDAAMYDDFVESLGAPREAVDSQLQEGKDLGQIFEADSWKALAQAAGLDADQLVETVEGYNVLCEAGADTDFGRAPEYLRAFGDGPYLAIRTGHLVICSFAGVCTDLKARALDKDGKPVPGLYVVGNDGAMLWANEYTIIIPGGTNGHNVNSGRVAAQDAVGLLG